MSELNYTDISEVGCNGYSQVFKCRKGEEWIFLKVLLKEFRDKPKYISALKREMAMAQKLDDNSSLKYMNYVDTPQYGPAIEIGYIEGRTLKDYLAERHTSDEKLQIVRGIAKALSYLHAKNITHGHLTLSAIWVASVDDRVYLSDFRVLSADSYKELPADTKYMAPELKDGTMTVDTKADFYSIGVIMRDLGLTLECDAVIKKCCSYGRNERYYDTDEFLQALDGGGHHHDTKGRKRLIGAVIILVVVVIGAFSLWNGGTSAALQATADTDTVAATLPTADSESAVRDSTGTKPNAISQDGGEQLTGKLAFLAEMKPALYHDLDGIFQPYLEASNNAQPIDRYKLQKAIQRYYKGLIKAQKGLDSDQRAALDQLFGNYVAQKKQQLH